MSHAQALALGLIYCSNSVDVNGVTPSFTLVSLRRESDSVSHWTRHIIFPVSQFISGYDHSDVVRFKNLKLIMHFAARSERH